jgi:hypothetical protein
MSYDFVSDRRYRMPTHFGPFPGPRQIPEGKRNDAHRSPTRWVTTVAARTSRAALGELVPPGFDVEPDPVIAIDHEELTDVDWLAGRGYSTRGVRFPVTYTGVAQAVRGNLLVVLWENLADPIISGREELGFSKVYCELPAAEQRPGGRRCTAAWLGQHFFDMTVSDLREVPAPSRASADTLHYKYVPRTGEVGLADAAYVTLTPAANPTRTVISHQQGNGAFRFHPSIWEELPTLYHIVNRLAAIPVDEFLSGTVTHTRGGKDLSDQRIVR